MSIQSKLLDISTYVTDIKSALVAKGSTPSGGLSTYAAAVSAIDTSSGGSGSGSSGLSYTYQYESNQPEYQEKIQFKIDTEVTGVYHNSNGTKTVYIPYLVFDRLKLPVGTTHLNLNSWHYVFDQDSVAGWAPPCQVNNVIVQDDQLVNIELSKNDSGEIDETTGEWIDDSYEDEETGELIEDGHWEGGDEMYYVQDPLPTLIVPSQYVSLYESRFPDYTVTAAS